MEFILRDDKDEVEVKGDGATYVEFKDGGGRTVVSIEVSGKLARVMSSSAVTTRRWRSQVEAYKRLVEFVDDNNLVDDD